MTQCGQVRCPDDTPPVSTEHLDIVTVLSGIGHATLLRSSRFSTTAAARISTGLPPQIVAATAIVPIRLPLSISGRPSSSRNLLTRSRMPALLPEPTLTSERTSAPAKSTWSVFWINHKLLGAITRYQPTLLLRAARLRGTPRRGSSRRAGPTGRGSPDGRSILLRKCLGSRQQSYPLPSFLAIR